MTSTAAYFQAKLDAETDPSDLDAALRDGEDVIVVDVRSTDAWRQGRLPSAIHIPYREIAERAPAEIPATSRVVVYCWSPGCNAGAKGALEFARLGYDVREMIGGYEYWRREGYRTVNDEGDLPRIFDPLVMYVRPSTAS